MSAQDVLVLAEIQRNVLADVTLELLAAARGWRPRPAGRSWHWCSAPAVRVTRRR